MDMQQYLTDTRELIDERKYSEALERMLWFHDNALLHKRSMYGVRLSFALRYWHQLGEVYPPARVAMVEVRDKKRDMLLRGESDHELFDDVLALNRTMEVEELSVDLFLAIEKSQPELAITCWRRAASLILDQQRYDVAQRHMGDVHQVYMRIRDRYERNLQLYDDPKIGGEHFISFNESDFVTEVLRLLGYISARGEDEGEIRSSAYALVADERLARLGT